MEGQGEDYFIEVEGIPIPQYFTPEVFRGALKYKPTPGQIVVSSFPKCGTSWLLNIVMQVMRKGEPFTTARDYFSSFMVQELHAPLIENTPSMPRFIQTHLPFHRLNHSPEVKYLYLSRHPADCLMSLYHFLRYIPYSEKPIEGFDKLFDLFLAGKVGYGDFFDNLLSWYEQRNLPNVLFITFESMKKDHEGAILKVAEFIDPSLVGELMADDKCIVKQILHNTSLDVMKASVNDFYEEAFKAQPGFDEDPTDFAAYRIGQLSRLLANGVKKGFKKSSSRVRKGEVGEGKSALSEEQEKRLNDRIVEKLGYLNITDLWKGS